MKSGNLIGILALIILFCWSAQAAAEDLPRVVRGLGYAADYLAGMYPPAWGVLARLRDPFVETFQMAVVGTTLATFCALPISFLAAKNTSPHTSIWAAARGVINVLRAVPTLLWALIFVALVGLGPLAGILALVCHCTGTLGRYFADAIESIGPKFTATFEAMRLDGASEAQVIWYGILPEVLPLFVGYFCHYFEWSFRAGTVLGLVGAGGIGLELTMSVRMFRRQEALAILIVIVAIVILVDLCGRFLRVRTVAL